MKLRHFLAKWQSVDAGRGGSFGDSGFTIIELLVVVILIPIILGAVAEAFILTLQQDTSNKNRISDSSNAQITSAYFVRDVQGANELTTFDFQGPLQQNGPPQVCAPGHGTLTVAFFRAPNATSTPPIPALDVAYRVQGTQLNRYSCTYNSATSSSTSPVGVLISEDVGTTASDLQVDITPSQFCGTTGNANCPASTGWMSIAAANAIASTQNLSSATIYVDGTAGFVANQPITVVTTSGPTQITCGTISAAGVSPPNFSNCTGPNVTARGGATVTQGAVSGVHISVNQTGSSYRFSLIGSPRSSTLADFGPCAGSNCTFPSLITLGSNPGGVSDGGNGTVTVAGGMMVDGGGISCGGASSINVSGGVDSSSSVSNTCGQVAPLTQPFLPDPISPQLPTPCFPQLALSSTDGSSTGTLQPGRYTNQISFNNGTTYMEPGVYELDGGISLAGNANLDLEPGTPAGQGVLLYVPGPGPYQSGCAQVGVAQAIGLGGGATVDLPALGNGPVPASLANVPVLQQLWIWEDGSVPAGTTATLGGNATNGQIAGLAYLPATTVSLHGTPGEVTGKIIAANLSLIGNSGITVSGS